MSNNIYRKVENIYWLFIALVVFSQSLMAESFGRNKVQYAYSHWQYIETVSFKIFFPEGYENLARFAEKVLEDALFDVQRDLGYNVEEPIPVVIYASPSDFLETNIIYSILTEGVGGFTESFKTRVVVPFNGSYKDFKHVLIHEMTHAVVFDMLLGRGPFSLLSMNRVFQIPLWMAEGISEWESMCWDEESDMYLRDAILNDYVKRLSEIDGFLAYKQGASVIGHIAKKYGRRKIGEILGKGKVYLTPDIALKSAIGLDQKELYEEWLNLKKREYFPEYGTRMRPEDIAKRLTDHKKERSYFNVMPSFSPDGHRVAFISDRGDYTDLYVMDVIFGKTRRIAKGERGGAIESFHPFRSRPGWSTDGQFLAFSKKSGGIDEIAIYSTNNWKLYKTMRFENIKEISSPVFFPGDTGIVFCGLIEDRVDLFYTLFDGTPWRRLTDDIFDDRFPTVSPDGRFIVFSSDRVIEKASSGKMEREKTAMTSGMEDINEIEFGSYNIWQLDIESGELEPLTLDGKGNGEPVFSADGKKIAFTSERNGIKNIWLMDFGDTASAKPLTDLLSGAFSPTWDPDNSGLVFSAFYDGGFDLYHLKNLTTLDSLKKTPFALLEESPCPPLDTIGTEKSFGSVTGDLRKYSFSTKDTEEGEYETKKPKKYVPQFSADLVTGSLGYSTYYGFMGQTILLFSDILGNHQILVATDLLGDLDNSTVYLDYAYLARRIDYGTMVYHYKNYFIDDRNRWFSDRVYGAGFYGSYPFSRFSRMQLTGEAFVVDREFYWVPWNIMMPDNISPSNIKLELSVVKDNSLWRSTGPIAGSRAKIALEYVPQVSDSGMNCVAGRFDYRKYYHFGMGYGFAFRLSGGAARGERKPMYWLGGIESWLNWKLATEDIYSLRDFYFSRMIMPLRGHDYFAYGGSTYFISNLEFRYPFVKQLSLGFPPITIRGINGGLFTDIGAVAGDDLDEFRGWKNGRLNDIKMGIGFGARAWIWLFLLQYDIAWKTNLSDIPGKPVHIISLGAEF